MPPYTNNLTLHVGSYLRIKVITVQRESVQLCGVSWIEIYIVILATGTGATQPSEWLVPQLACLTQQERERERERERDVTEESISFFTKKLLHFSCLFRMKRSTRSLKSPVEPSISRMVDGGTSSEHILDIVQNYSINKYNLLRRLWRTAQIGPRKPRC